MSRQAEIVVGREVRQPRARRMTPPGPCGELMTRSDRTKARPLNPLKLACEELLEIHPFIKCSISPTASSIPTKIARETME